MCQNGCSCYCVGSYVQTMVVSVALVLRWIPRSLKYLLDWYVNYVYCCALWVLLSVHA